MAVCAAKANAVLPSATPHDAPAGMRPCLKCKGCENLDLHFWRKVCINCSCKEADHAAAQETAKVLDLEGLEDGAVAKRKQQLMNPAQDTRPPRDTGSLSKDILDRFNTLSALREERKRMVQKFQGAPCTACSKATTKDNGVKALGKTYHAGCFACFKCKNELPMAFYEDNGEPYCMRCFGEQHFPRCMGCEELIFHKEYTKATMPSGKEMTFCLDHFCCVGCDTPLAEKQFIEGPEGDDVFCLPCYDSKLAPKCATCHENVTTDQPLMQAGALAFHGTPECFKCADCGVPLHEVGGAVADGKLLCPEHSRRGKTCSGCGEGLDGECINAGGAMYHKKCFVCSKCNTFTGSMGMKDSKLICKECA
eukprot:m.494705 g.494705  ORF g.494705 m.494705 type:complete len:365 (-) comp41563_c0_seq1:171-1265(-)